MNSSASRVYSFKQKVYADLTRHNFGQTEEMLKMLMKPRLPGVIIIDEPELGLLTADDIIVVERENNQTVFKRQSEEALAAWREEYSLGELWSKNVLGGTP